MNTQTFIRQFIAFAIVANTGVALAATARPGSGDANGINATNTATSNKQAVDAVTAEKVKKAMAAFAANGYMTYMQDGRLQSSLESILASQDPADKKLQGQIAEFVTKDSKDPKDGNALQLAGLVLMRGVEKENAVSPDQKLAQKACPVIFTTMAENIEKAPAKVGDKENMSKKNGIRFQQLVIENASKGSIGAVLAAKGTLEQEVRAQDPKNKDWTLDLAALESYCK